MIKTMPLKLIIGLGNPGLKYQKTRHNLGWRVLDELSQTLKIEDWQDKSQFQAQIALGRFQKQKITLAKPQTFMNNSGIAISSIINYYKIPLSNILIVHDDIDFNLGEIKIQRNRGSAKHKGVESIIDQLKTKDFARLRMGIRSKESEKETDLETFVLKDFTPWEEEIVQKAIKKAIGLIKAFLKT